MWHNILRPFGSDKAVVYYYNMEDALVAAKTMKCKTLGDLQIQVFFIRADQIPLPPPKITALRTRYIYVPYSLTEQKVNQVAKFLSITMESAMYFSFQGTVLQCKNEEDASNVLEWFKVSASPVDLKSIGYIMLDDEDVHHTSKLSTRKIRVAKERTMWDTLKSHFLSFAAFDHMRIYLDADYATVTYRSEEHAKFAMRNQKFTCEFLEMNPRV